MQFSRHMGILSLIFMVPCLQAWSQVHATASGPVLLHAGVGSTELAVENSENTAVPLALSFGPFTDEALHTTLIAPRFAFVDLPGSGKLPRTMKPREMLRIAVTIGNLTGSSVASAQLFNQNAAIGLLKFVSLDAPLNISIDGDGSAGKPLDYLYGNPASILLKNIDVQSYTVSWTFQLNGHTQGGIARFAPNGSAKIQLQPARKEYTFSDRIRPSVRSGILSLRVVGPDEVASELYPSKSLPVSVSMTRLTPTGTKRWSYGYAFGLLLLGGVFSLLGSALLPNILKRIDLRGQLSDLANRTSSVSTRVDSYLRVLLRLERKKIDVLLQTTWIFSLAVTDRFDQAAQAIDRLSKRLDFAERLDALRRRFERISVTAPPSVTDDVDNILQAAADQLHSFALPDVNLNAASGFLDQAEAALGKLDDSDSMAKLIAQRFSDLKVRVAQFPNEYYADLQVALPGIFRILTEPIDDPKNISPRMQLAIDHAIAAIHCALDYAIVRASLPAGATANCSDPGRTARERLFPHECDLIELLGTFSWRALRDATILVQQMREDLYASDVMQKISQEGQAKVIFDTQRARPYLPVFLTIGFEDPRFNGAAAINWLVCHWTFPGDLHEDNWKVCHFFQPNDQHPRRVQSVDVTATIRSESALTGRIPQSFDLIGRIEIQGTVKNNEYSRFWAEFLRFSIAFGVALAALWSGALTQLQKLDFVSASFAIVAFGYGADSIKNLLAQAPKKSQS